jgi:hypothetical protein
MKNVHVRRFSASIEEVRVWIAACWSGGDRDCFPRDVIASWRHNPDGVDPAALVPGKTLVGHGPFRFLLREWDGVSWKVDLVDSMTGWHGFDLAPDGDGCRVTHTVSLASSLSARLRWMAIAPVHDWAVEAMFDRLEHALRTGAVPSRTQRPMPPLAALGMRMARRSQRGKRGGREARAGADLYEVLWRNG